MRSSLRRRLQLWYGVVLCVSIAGFAAFLYLRVRETRWRELDNELLGGAQYLDATMRTLPRGELTADRPGPRGERPGPRDRPDRPPPKPGYPPPPDRPPRPQASDLKMPLFQGPRRGASAGDEPYFCVRRPDDSTLASASLPADFEFSPVKPQELGPTPRVVSRGEYREVLMQGPARTRIVVGRSTAPLRRSLQAFAWQLAGIGSVMLAVGLAGGRFVSALISRPLRAISATASRISADRLSERIPDRDVDEELAPLVAVLNQMFARLEAAFAEQTRFTADASHELRTPLTVLRMQAELALSKSRSVDDYRQALDTCLQAARRMSRLVESLLTLARSDAGHLELDRRPADVAEIVRASLREIEPLAVERGVRLAAELRDCPAQVDAQRLTQVIVNLVSNAVQASAAGMNVRVSLAAEGAEFVLRVADQGCGIPEASRPHLFERFYRVDAARARSSGGTGLGLAIVRSIVQSHGGTVTFTSTEGQGTTFEVRCPTNAT